MVNGFYSVAELDMKQKTLTLCVYPSPVGDATRTGTSCLRHAPRTTNAALRETNSYIDSATPILQLFYSNLAALSYALPQFD